MISFNDLVTKAGINPNEVNIIRHTPDSPELRRSFPWIASERPDLFYMYQSTHAPQREAMFLNRSYAASFVVNDLNQTIFIGFYKIGNHCPISREAFAKHPLGEELYSLGCSEISQGSRLQFDLDELDEFKPYKGRIVLDWQSGTRSFIQILGAREYIIESIHPNSILVPNIPEWTDILLSYAELKTLPNGWKERMTQWRGIYLITDKLDGKQYVGSAYGNNNIFQRWMEYAISGHGQNKLLKNRSPKNFIFSILQLVSPSADSFEVLKLEANWKKRLLSREFGLNAN